MAGPSLLSGVPNAGNDEPQSARVALEQFVYDNEDLERLEAVLSTFNPFVAMRWTRQEIRHSAFLRWLLDPSETHGLGDYFLGLLLKRVAKRSATGGPSVVDIDSWDLSRAVVHHEWRGVDVLVQDDANRFVAVIENKTDSTEHSDQLRRYRLDVERHFPSHSRLFVYLTPGADTPSDDWYTPVGYAEIVLLLKDMLERRGEQVAGEVRTFLQQYVEMVGRHIVEDSEIQALCRKIYDRHRKALDMLFEYKPDRTQAVNAMLLELLTARPELVADHCTKSYVRFAPATLEFIPKVGSGWTPTGRMLVFEIQNVNGEVKLSLILGPGEQAIRDLLYSTIHSHPKVFNKATQPVYPKFWTCHREKWIGPKQYEELDADAFKHELEQHFDHLVTNHVPAIVAALLPLQQDWV
jgi:PD-(D/E)XK nuclease superfamily